VSTVYGLLLHRPQQLLGTSGKALYQTLHVLKETGLIQKVGVSVYAPSELEALIPQYHFDLVQTPLNLVDRRLVKTGWLKKLKDKGIEIHTRSAFLQGLLLMSPKIIPAKFASWSDLWNRWHTWLAEQQSAAVATSLAFPLSFPEIDRVVVGADSVSQLTQIIGATKNLPVGDFPEISCDDENLIDPSRWAGI
jgi:aryl-alcohol dehydrogenase-like predicted oxidoreductase